MPSNQETTRVFYGWWVVAASFFIAAYVGGVTYYGFTTIFQPIADELGWSYTQISLAASLRGMEMGLLAPLVGILADRFGPRRLIFSGAAITTLGFILLSRTTSLGMFYGAFALIAMGMSGCSLTVLMTAVTSWFRKKVGIASGIAMSGFAVGGLLILPMVRLIETYDWRVTIFIFAIGISAIILPLSIVFRHKPEQYGYLPDGHLKEPRPLRNEPSLPQSTEVPPKASDLLKNNIFWRLTLTFACFSILIGAVFTHIMPYLDSIGITRSQAGMISTILPLISIGGRVGLGWLSDKVDARRVAAATFAMMGLGLFFFGYASTAGIWLLVPFLALFGIGYGGANVLRTSLIRRYFSGSNFGAVFGLTTGISFLIGIIGPPLAGWVYDNWGIYQGIWLVFAGLPVAAIISLLTIPQPTPRYNR